MSSLLFGNGTNLVHWQSSPNTRGTFDILTTCMLTMLLCVWTAVHLNISQPGRFWEPKFRKCGWLILALIAPELIAFSAWSQRQRAHSIMRQVNHKYGMTNPLPWYTPIVKPLRRCLMKAKAVLLLPGQRVARQPTVESQKPSPATDRHAWTLTHGFYAAMGGLAIQVSRDLPESKRFLPAGAPEIWFLTNRGINDVLAAENTAKDELPDISTEEIKAKSKANGLAKALVCLQAMWFLAQCITRLAQRIPVALLELNTFGHALCALLIYIIWWEKPFEVDYPTIIQSDYLSNACALRWMSKSSMPPMVRFVQRECEATLKRNNYFLSPSKIRFLVPRFTGGNQKLSYETDLLENFSEDRLGGSYAYPTCVEEGAGLQETAEAAVTALPFGHYLHGTGLKLSSLSKQLEWIARPLKASPLLRKKAFHAPDKTDFDIKELILTVEDVNRWRMAWRAIQTCEIVDKADKQGRMIPQRPGIYRLARLLTERSSDIAGMEDFIMDTSIILGFSTAALIYGGLHALAWFAHFRSSTEQLLWRVSSCLVMGSLPVIYALFRLFDKFMDGMGHFVFPLIGIPMGLLNLAYWLARVYLVVECFINLSHLPAGVYDLPSWSAYFPHIS